jgi:hypothetical protein
MPTSRTTNKQTHLDLEKYVPGLLLWLSNKLGEALRRSIEGSLGLASWSGAFCPTSRSTTPERGRR